eukprot:gene648-949_t
MTAPPVAPPGVKIPPQPVARVIRRDAAAAAGPAPASAALIAEPDGRAAALPVARQCFAMPEHLPADDDGGERAGRPVRSRSECIFVLSAGAKGWLRALDPPSDSPTLGGDWVRAALGPGFAAGVERVEPGGASGITVVEMASPALAAAAAAAVPAGPAVYVVGSLGHATETLLDAYAVARRRSAHDGCFGRPPPCCEGMRAALGVSGNRTLPRGGGRLEPKEHRPPALPLPGDRVCCGLVAQQESLPRPCGVCDAVLVAPRPRCDPSAAPAVLRVACPGPVA